MYESKSLGMLKDVKQEKDKKPAQPSKATRKNARCSPPQRGRFRTQSLSCQMTKFLALSQHLAAKPRAMPQFAPVGEQVPMNPAIVEQERIAREKREKLDAEERAAKALARGNGGGGGGAGGGVSRATDSDESATTAVKKEPVFHLSSTQQAGEFDDDERTDLVSLRLFGPAACVSLFVNVQFFLSC